MAYSDLKNGFIKTDNVLSIIKPGTALFLFPRELTDNPKSNAKDPYPWMINMYQNGTGLYTGVSTLTIYMNQADDKVERISMHCPRLIEEKWDSSVLFGQRKALASPFLEKFNTNSQEGLYKALAYDPKNYFCSEQPNWLAEHDIQRIVYGHFAKIKSEKSSMTFSEMSRTKDFMNNLVELVLKHDARGVSAFISVKNGSICSSGAKDNIRRLNIVDPDTYLDFN